MTDATNSEEQVDPQALWDEIAAEKADPASPSVKQAEPPPAEEPPQAQDAPKAEETPNDSPPSDAPKPADPLEALPPELRDKLAKVDALERTLQAQHNDMKSAIGRIGALQRELDAAKKISQQAGGNAPTQAQIANAAKSPEKWEAMKADFPDWGEAIDEMVNHRLAGLQPQQTTVDPTQVDSLVEQRVAQERETLRREIEEYKVELKHGDDWKAKINTPEFLAWYQVQDAATKQLADSPKGADAVKLLDKYEESRAKPVEEIKTDRTARLQAAATTRPGQNPPPKTEDDMSPEELWNYLAKKRAA